jgi:hypothetical protein
MAREIGLLCALFAVGFMMFSGCGKDEASPEEAETSLKKVQEYITAQKFDEAEDLLKKLEANKDKYSESVQSQVEAARKSLDAAKAGGEGIELPKLPGT